MFGYSSSEALELRVEALVPEHLKAQHRAGMARYAETGHGLYIDSHRLLELPALRKGGEEIHVELSLSPIGPVDDTDSGRRFVLAIVRDITERKEAEEKITEANRRLKKLAVLKADFTAMVAHELDAPFAAIRGYADMLSTGKLEPVEQTHVLAKIQAQTDALEALVADVRAAAAVEHDDFAIERRRVSVGVLLDDAAAFAETFPGNHPLAIENAADEQVWADPPRIGQVLRNLLSNAAKYSPEGAPIELRAKPGETPGCVRIEVADRGQGIHTDDVARIFEKFGRGCDRYGRKVAGVGLGLHISRHILQAHGSELVLDSTPGSGSVFGFELEIVR